jgi:hypothetical protein
LQSKNFPPDKRHPGHRSRYGKYGPRSGYGFLRTACQPIRIENFEKPYNNSIYYRTSLPFCQTKHERAYTLCLIKIIWGWLKPWLVPSLTHLGIFSILDKIIHQFHQGNLNICRSVVIRALIYRGRNGNRRALIDASVTMARCLMATCIDNSQ